jgi:hypothetical protein
MVVHTCERCNIEFNKKSHYLVHINRKFKCKEIKKDSEIFQIIPQQLKNNENLNNNIIICNYCNKIFSTIFNLNKHCKNNCKVKKIQDVEKENIFKILLAKEEEEKKELKKKEEEIKKKDEHINKLEDYIKNLTNMNFELNNKVGKLLEKVSVNNINNGTINQVNNIIISKDQLCNFGNEDVTKIDTKLFKKIKGKTGKFIFRQCAENIFNNLSNNQTLYVSDLSRDRAMAFENGEWKIIPMQKAIDTVTNQIRLYFKHNSKDAELLKDPEFKKEYDDYLVKYYKKYYDEYDKNDRYRPPQETLDEYARVVNEELKRFFYDIRNKVQNNYSNIKKQILNNNILKQIEYVPPKRGRGRPKTAIFNDDPKPKVIVQELVKEINNEKKTRGRPKKMENEVKQEANKEIKEIKEIKENKPKSICENNPNIIDMGDGLFITKRKNKIVELK